MNDAVDEITIPIAIIGIALLAYTGFFQAAKEWVQTRVGTAANPEQSGPPESTVNPNQTPYQGNPIA